VTLAAGHFKQTRNGAFIEAAINIILSIVLVIFYGLVGVAIAILCAMLFRTIQYAVYLSRNILHRSIGHFINRCLVNFLAMAIIIILAKLIPATTIDTYAKWFIHACQTTFSAATVTILINTLFYTRDFKELILVAKRLVKPKT
jgi:peptidoglycan biosynthesis protein MviN/MurJ (putative lipid II flippase)